MQAPKLLNLLEEEKKLFLNCFLSVLPLVFFSNTFNALLSRLNIPLENEQVDEQVLSYSKFKMY